MNNDCQAALENIGLTQNEARIYMVLLEAGPTPAGKLAEKAGVHRPNVYDALQRLRERGLVKEKTDERKVHCFAAQPAEALRSLLRNQEEQLSSILPRLRLAKQLSGERNTAAVYMGTSAFFQLLCGLLRHQQEIFAYGLSAQAMTHYGDIIHRFHEERIAKKIPIRAIFNEDAKERLRTAAALPYCEARFLAQQYAARMSVDICADECIITLWDEKPHVIHIRQQAIADSYRRYFTRLWEQSCSPGTELQGGKSNEKMV